MSRVLAINGSARMERGRLEALLRAFLGGMEGAGADVEVVYASRLKVGPCTAELHCWNDAKGECHIKDAMQALYTKLKAADTWVLATPVNIPIPGELQNILNRMCALLEPRLATRAGRTRARLRPDVRTRRLVLVSTSGWWEMGNFGTVVRIARELAATSSIEFSGAVLRPHSQHMMSGGKVTERGREVLGAARAAGAQLESRGRMDPRTLRAVSRPLVSRKEYFGD